MVTVGILDSATVFDAGSICGDDPQCEVLFPLVTCSEPTT